MPAKKLLLLDSHAMIFRAFFAIRQPMTDGRGLPTNAVHGFASILIALLRAERPTHAVVATDMPGRTFREEKCEKYKAHRAPPPEDLIAQIAPCHDFARALGIPVIGAPGFEADDVIGTIAPRAAAEDFAVAIGSGDRDLLQLVDEKVSLVTLDSNPQKRVIFDPAGVAEKYGIPPTRLPLWKAIAGDASDNIAGIPGLGPKAAGILAAEFSTPEAIFTAVRAGDPRIPPATAKKLADPTAPEALAHGLFLATIRRDAPVDFDEKNSEIPEPPVLGPALDFCREKNLRQIAARLTRDLGPPPEKAPPPGDEHAPGQLGLF